MSTAEETDLVTVITEDHRSVEKVFDELQRGNGSDEHRRNLADHMIAELVRHSVAEEQFMYPATRKYVAGGDDIADHEISEHGEVEQLLKNLEGVDPSHARFNELVSAVVENVRHHVEEEENDLLPKLRSAVSEQELRELGDRVLRAKEVAPTRPHPSAPKQPPANLIVQPGAGFIDKIRDGLGKRNT